MKKNTSYLHQYDEKMILDEIDRLHFNCREDEANIYQSLVTLNFTAKSRLLDVGCGPGSSTVIIHNFNPDGQVVGLDYEKRFIEYAKDYAKNHNLSNITFTEGDCTSLPFPDEEFDQCFTRYVMQHVVEPEVVLHELIRVTKKGGRIGIFENDDGLTCFSPEPRHLHKFLEAKKTVRRFSGGDIFFGRKLYQLFHRASLQNLTVQRLFRDIHYPGKQILAKSFFWNDDLTEKHPYVQMKLMTAQEILEYKEDLQKLFDSPDAYMAFGGYFVCGEKV